ncbi:MAG TPA: recombinase [Chryseobacterium sp.]|nr:recombinase [Chryseobacterium sp.]
MQHNFSFLFYLKKPKSYLSGAIPIYLRITVNGKRAEITTGRECLPEKWNANAGKAIGTKEETKALNIYLDTLQNKLYKIHRELIEETALISAEVIKNKFTGKSERTRSLVEIFKDHNQKLSVLIGNEYASATVTRYGSALKHTIDFLKWKYNKTDIDINAIDLAFINDFEFYLRSVRKCNNNSAVKYVKSNFGKIIRHCLANGWLNKDPFINYASKQKPVIRAYLTQKEIEAIAEKKLNSIRLNQVKDIFLFSCYTGLAYVDVNKLTRSNVALGIDGCKWIFTSRQKTDTPSNIPLLPAAENILEKYKEHPQCTNQGKLLPVLSNQKMNSYLKEIGDLCGVTKELTFHIARHTFATTVTLSNGVPIESVSKMLGHKNLRTTQHYAKILDSKVSEDMKALSQKFRNITIENTTLSGSNSLSAVN